MGIGDIAVTFIALVVVGIIIAFIVSTLLGPPEC